ncbi:protein NRT1/ PTR FAMILY 7.3 [Lingula anatina]|uniref:Protein NRT1/ PTR FAMILY 7.3 n=1 Tax=Lingula anatina TaxID=7574 RepID=A0A1S3J9I0_LINAN|nr:protein NRT1/ PTR FAMILY 7.3 [Lingula anatina]|eukprot:XP_013407060.1 protein NRT1/ PTR FAMILY 7.3 [Lingula anatina]
MGSNVRLKESWKVISVVCSCCPITSRIRSGSRRMSLGVNVKSIKKAIAEKKKRVRRMVQILLVNSSVFGFGILYSQMLTTYEFQARGMDRMINGNVTLPIPETCMLAFNELAILVFIPILVKCIYPCIENRGRSTGYFTRMGFGMVCAALSGLYGIILEVSRQQSCHQFDGVPKLSGLWQGPEYAIIGLGETLTFIAAMEYSYLEAPTGLRGTAMGLFNLGFGLSYCVALIVVTIVDKLTDWYTVDLKDTCLTHNIGHLERYLLLLLGFLALCAISFVIVAFYLSSQKRKSAATTSTS